MEYFQHPHSGKSSDWRHAACEQWFYNYQSLQSRTSICHKTTLLVSLQPLVDSSNPPHRPVIQSAQMTSVIPWQEGFPNIVKSLLALLWRCLALCFRYQCWLINKQRTSLLISISDSFHKKTKLISNVFITENIGCHVFGLSMMFLFQLRICRLSNPPPLYL